MFSDRRGQRNLHILSVTTSLILAFFCLQVNPIRPTQPRRLLILGCGLAGSAIAWEAHRRGWELTVVDRMDFGSCSRVAAGLVTPITGGRSAASWRWEEFFSCALNHYLLVEEETCSQFWTCKRAMRIFLSEQEMVRTYERWGNEVSQEVIATAAFRPRVVPCTSEELKPFSAPWGGCWMEPAGRLETASYLNATHSFLIKHHRWLMEDVDVDTELSHCNDSSVSNRFVIEKLGVEADVVVFCQGIDSRRNKWFPDLPLHPARGDIIEVEWNSFTELEHVVHSSTWMVPESQSGVRTGSVRTGATYDRHTLDGIVDNRDAVCNAREILVGRLKETLSEDELSRAGGEIRLKGQRAAVRPASYDRHPLMGKHREIADAYVLNGLGSKGTLMAPGLASRLLDLMEGGAPIERELDWQRGK